MSKRDYYEVLGVSKTTDEQELKKAYRRLAMKFHPDRNPGDKEAESNFKEAKEAYEVLSDDNKRAAYDRFGHAGVDAAAQGGFGGGGFGGGGGDGVSFSDVFSEAFSEFFGGGRSSGGSGRGADLQYNLEVDLEQAVRGAQIEIKIPTQVRCEPCDGSGAKPGSKPVSCRTCGGVGQVRIQQGFIAIQQTCPSCRGRGQTISDPCSGCRGTGQAEKTKTVSVKIPAGVDTGDRVRLSGEGNAGRNGGTMGDLYVQIIVKEHPIFKRQEQDLYTEVPISFIDAALGGELDVPTLDGKVRLKIPAETQTGKLFRLRGKGVQPVRGGNKGDLLCRVIVETPVNLTKVQKDLLKQFQETLENDGNKQSPKKTSWFEGVKNFFDDMKL